ncbi:hypothetical protein GWK36_14260 [Caldichromatium japonicum]|uniref:C-methyltransferase domain-containing protein n=1 Tax=Caldichromatium japonicum TaxID=2699430 RepID=A0A6G7VG85_9GAMM|nr:hypothetical protein GWK36_14260 [Caldichromatium japonicum]
MIHAQLEPLAKQVYLPQFPVQKNRGQGIIEQKRADKKVAAYGAAAKGNTLLNFAGIKPDLLPFVCDAAPARQNKFLPGSHIPILALSVLMDFAPDYLLILPWNIAEEVREQNAALAARGTQFVTAVPHLTITSC